MRYSEKKKGWNIGHGTKRNWTKEMWKNNLDQANKNRPSHAKVEMSCI